MSLVVTGLSHHTSGIELRERMAFSERETPGALLRLRRQLDEAGAVIVSTCNRTEVYLSHAGNPDDLHREIRAFLAEAKDIPETDFAEALYEFHDREAVGHLFRVTSSLDSLVVGEGQILGQVHDAYLLAQSEQATDKVINALFQKAFTVAKKVRSQSTIGSGKVSISSVAVDLAVSIFMELSDKTVMVVGSGEMADLTLKSLVSQGVGHVIVVNRSIENAKELAAVYNGEAVTLDRIDEHLHRADIVITSTAAPTVVLKSAQFQRALRERNRKPMFVIDIAVPRDVEETVNELDNVYLYDIDDLQEVADRNLEARRTEVDRCLEIVDEGVESFWRWFRGLVAEPTSQSLSPEFNTKREREQEKTHQARGEISETDRQEIDYLTKRIVNNILQQPLAQLKQEVHHHHDAGTVLQLVRRLFGLKEST